MRKLILQMQLSLDMFVGTEDGDTSWMQWSWGDDWTWSADLQQYHIDTTTSADRILLSDRMAQEGFIDHWAAMAKRTDNPQSAFAQNITRAQKVVFGRSPGVIRWERTLVADDDLITTVNNLKQASGKNLLAFGGAGFAASLVQANLVDEFHLIVNPTILGKGLSIFSKAPEATGLKLISADPYPEGVVVLRYGIIKKAEL